MIGSAINEASASRSAFHFADCSAAAFSATSFFSCLLAWLWASSPQRASKGPIRASKMCPRCSAQCILPPRSNTHPKPFYQVFRFHRPPFTALADTTKLWGHTESVTRRSHLRSDSWSTEGASDWRRDQAVVNCEKSGQCSASRLHPTTFSCRGRPTSQGRWLAARTEMGWLQISDHQGWRRGQAVFTPRR